MTTQTFHLDDWLTEFSRHIKARQPYREPTPEEAAAFIGGLWALIRGDTESPVMAELGFTTHVAVDTKTNRPFTLVYNEYGTERAWGAYVIDTTFTAAPRPIRGLVEAPHIVFDTYSEKLALEIWRAYPGILLLISGTHRTDVSFTNPRDVAHQPGSLFHQVAMAFTKRGIPQFQQHGFSDETDPEHDIIISSGDAKNSEAIKRLADALEAAGFRIARNWDNTATIMKGMDNVQGAAAEADGTAFAHVEVSKTVRVSEELRARYLQAVAAAHFFTA
ncbi:MAG TPA: hypothetical protein VD907_04020 [Verrucomicrobiae bacterium]|nr:hypothetical protein [Verrucomicrobiae bacterium]